MSVNETRLAHSSCASWISLALLCTCGSTGADELRLDATRLFERGVIDNLTQMPDAAGLTLVRGVLVEDDGPAAGYAYRPNEEVLSETTWIQKTLLIADPRAAQATLLVGSGGDLQARINGQAVPLTAAGKAGNYWQMYTLPAEALRAGANEIVLSGQGKVWIARAEDFAAGDLERPQHPNRSARSTDAGRTWDDAKLGTKGDVDGEYYVRLFLDQYRPAGSVVTSVLDAGNLQGDPLAPATTDVGPVTITPSVTVPEGTRVMLRVRSGASLRPNDAWSKWESHEATRPVVVTPRGRFLQLAFDLATSDARTTPRLDGVTIAAAPQRPADWRDRARIVEQQNPAIVRTSLPFAYEPFDHPALARLRREQRLDDVVAGAKSDWEVACRLAAWSARQWKSGHLGEAYPPWNALEILKPHADGRPVGGFCLQYNVVFLQACESFGLVGRAVSIGPGTYGDKIRSGHETVEIWSNEHRKWIYLDGQTAWYFVDRESRVPLSLLELRDRQLTTLRDEPAAEVECVTLAESAFTWTDLRGWPAFVDLRLIPRSNFLESPAPLPLHQGMRGWFWTGHAAWSDDRLPAPLLYSRRISHRPTWEWTLNQAEIRLEALAGAGRLRVHLDTETPGFAKYQARVNGAKAQDLAGEVYWNLAAGKNSLEVWPVNTAGRDGIPSSIVVDYRP